MARAILMPSSQDQRHDGRGGFADENRPSPLGTTAPHGYGRRAAASEVFLTNWRRDAADGWVVSARWPSAHGFHGSGDGPHDRPHEPLLLIETMRQAGILLSHLAHRVPLDHPITWQRIRYDLVPRALSAAGAPTEVELHVTDHEVIRRGKRLLSARQEFRVRRDGADLATATLDYACHSPSVYHRLRGRYSERTPADARGLPLPAPVAPQLVGRDRERDVVLSPTDRAGQWRLRVDTSHPVLFDQPVDHAPGMLMIEAARQAAQAATPGVTLPIAMECDFERCAELDAPCWVRARTAPEPAEAGAGDGRVLVDVAVEQHGKPVIAARIISLPIP